MQKIFYIFSAITYLRFRTVVKIPRAAAANQIAENAKIPPAADLQKYVLRFIANFIGHVSNMLYSGYYPEYCPRLPEPRKFPACFNMATKDKTGGISLTAGSVDRVFRCPSTDCGIRNYR